MPVHSGDVAPGNRVGAVGQGGEGDRHGHRIFGEYLAIAAVDLIALRVKHLDFAKVGFQRLAKPEGYLVCVVWKNTIRWRFGANQRGVGLRGTRTAKCEDKEHKE